MAKGNLFLGQARGKVGSIVQYVAKGEQRTRVYTREGGRPGDRATLPAREQRIRFGAASNEWALYKYICSNMFKSGKTTKESDYNFFVRKNWSYFPFLTKQENESGLAFFIPGTFATGNLGTCNIYIDNKAEDNLVMWRVFDVATSGTGVVKSTDTLDKFISFLKSAYPQATKVTIAILFNGLAGEVIGTPNMDNSRVNTFTIDLFNTPGSVARTTNVADYLKAMCKNQIWQEMCDYMSENAVTVASGSMILCLSNTTTNIGGTTDNRPGAVVKYTITYTHNGTTVTTQKYEEGATITPPQAPEGYMWKDLPSTMPAANVTVTTEIDENTPPPGSGGSGFGRGEVSTYIEILEEDSQNCLLYIFPTNDKANDVYTVNVLPYNLTSSSNAYLHYMMHRDERAMQDAASSYGYARDTMHANIYYSGDSIDSDIANSIRIMALIDGAAAETMSQNRDAIAEQRRQTIAAKRAALAADLEKADELIEQADDLIDQAIKTSKSRKKK